MIRRCINMISVLAAVLLCSCAVHQWPEPKGDSTQLLHLHYEPDFWLWEHLYDPVQGLVVERYPDSAVDDEHPGTTQIYSGIRDYGWMRIVVRVFRSGDVDNVLREYNIRA